MTTPTLAPSSPAQPRRRFKVGTTGWTADDLDDPRFAGDWERGRYEIVEGVLTLMPAAFFDGVLPVGRLQKLLVVHLHLANGPGDFTPEVDFVVGRKRVARPDLIFTTPDDQQRQAEANRRRGRSPYRFGRLLVPPTLVIEAVSPGHEEHDRDTKRRWYAEAGVPNFWILDGYARSLECLTLAGQKYRIDQAGREGDEVRPALFPGLVIPLADLWK